MATPESLTKDAVRRALKAAEDAGASIVHWMVIPAAGTVGFPDFLILVNGALLGVECKAAKEDGGKVATDKQLSTLEAIKAAGGHGMVVGCPDSFENLCGSLMWLGDVQFERPYWRSKQVQNRRKPPPLRGKG